MTAPTTAEIMQRFNEVFQRHDPTALAELVAPDCVIENTHPAPDGGRLEGAAGRRGWCRYASAMAFATGQAASERPSAIAVHHDRYVSRQPRRLQRKLGKFTKWK